MKNTKKWWIEKDNEGDSIIRFTVTSNGRSGSEWIEFFEKHKYIFHQGIPSHYDVEKLLNCNIFIPTKNVNYEVVILKGNIIKNSCDRYFDRFLGESRKRKYEQASREIFCLIREKFTDQEIENMGLRSIITTHKSHRDPKGHRYNLAINLDEGLEDISAINLEYKLGWNDGFAFIMPKK